MLFRIQGTTAFWVRLRHKFLKDDDDMAACVWWVVEEEVAKKQSRFTTIYSEKKTRNACKER